MSDILYPDFGKHGSQRSPDEANGTGVGIAAGVHSLLKNALPLHPGKVRELGEGARAFLTSLHATSRVELHFAADRIDDSAVLVYMVPGNDTPFTLPFDVFLDLLMERHFEPFRHSIEELLPILEELFQRINIVFDALNFSPRDHLNTTVESPWSPESLSEGVFVRGEYFYSIVTSDLEEEGLTVDPAHVLDGHPDAELIDLLALYFEESYCDTSKKYDDTTIVEIMRYSYVTGQTHIMKVSYRTLEGACLTAILDRHPLFRHFDDPAEIIEAYLDRSLSREVENPELFEFPSKT